MKGRLATTRGRLQLLVVIETHPVQYHAPVYRSVEQEFGIPVTAIYGSDLSVAGYTDLEFMTRFAWDVDLLSGYSHRFLATSRDGAAQSVKGVNTHGLRKTLRELHPKAILLLGYNPHFYQFAFWEARRVGCPLLFRGETTDHARSRSAVKAWIRDQVLRKLYRSFGRLLYVGQRSQTHFQRLGVPSEKLAFSPYCVEISRFQTGEEERMKLRDATRTELGLSSDQVVLLFSGKLSQRKGVDLLFAAVKAMPTYARQEFALLVLGSGELMQSLKTEAANEPQISAHFVGFQNQSQLSRFYHAADLLVLPSIRSETWGLVVNEALHHGLPCVVSDAVGCAPDLVISGETGEVCEAGSVGALGTAIERARPLVGRLSIREACRSRVDRFTVHHAAEGVARAYHALVKAPL